MVKKIKEILLYLQRLFLPQDLPDPKDRIKEDQIQVTKNKIVINQKGLSWSRIANTESMNPIIDHGHHAFFIKPIKEDLQVGDIISFYRKSDKKKNVMHRIIKIGEDKDGWYVIPKGDNCISNDGKTRFKDIKKVLIGIIY
jgi:signal peptidase I